MAVSTPRLLTVQRTLRHGTLMPIYTRSIATCFNGIASGAEPPAQSKRAWSGAHRIDLRASVPLPSGRWYVTILAGPERRSEDRLREEGQTHWTRRAAIYVMLMSLALWLVVCLIALAYVAKSALGIDVTDGHSPMHFIWEWFE
jgi:hypothetical protein